MGSMPRIHNSRYMQFHKSRLPEFRLKMHMIFHSIARKKKKEKNLQKQTRRGDKEKFFAISAGSVPTI